MELTEQQIQENKQQFIEIFKSKISRDGADRLLDYLNKSDFFTAPASTRFHGSYAGGLCHHSLNVYYCLCDYLARRRVKDEYGLTYSEETVAVSALLHDICKTDVYKKGIRWQKDENNQWEKIPTFNFEDNLPYGHGEKSVYMITGFMRLTREEAFAIRYHMGFSGASSEEKNNVGKAFEMFPLAFALSTADMEATYFIDDRQ